MRVKEARGAMEELEKDKRGMVLRIERSSIYDGDGFRTVVFLKGCPLRCQWCSTPESQSFEIERTKENTYGTPMTVEEVMREVRKDSLFFFVSTGGLTLSGGEIMAQPDFSRTLLQQAKRECFNTAIETSFFASWENVKGILQYVDTAFVDLKVFDREAHIKYCGVDNSQILSNLLATNELERQCRLIVRTPVIPGGNDSEENLDQIGAFCTQLNHLTRVQLLPYHKLGVATYEKLGRSYLLQNVQTPTPEAMERYRAIVRRHVSEVH